MEQNLPVHHQVLVVRGGLDIKVDQDLPVHHQVLVVRGGLDIKVEQNPPVHHQHHHVLEVQNLQGLLQEADLLPPTDGGPHVPSTPVRPQTQDLGQRVVQEEVY